MGVQVEDDVGRIPFGRDGAGSRCSLPRFEDANASFIVVEVIERFSQYLS